MILRPYQQNIVRDVCLNLKKRKRQLIVLPTGSGKTVVFAHVIKNMQMKALVIAHTNELIEQNKKTIAAVSNDTPFLVGTIQWASKNVDTLKKDNYQLIIIDECHRAAATSYQRIIDAFPNGKIIGVTATPFREDGKKITEIFGHPVCSMSIIDMIKEGFLCDFEGYRVTTNCSLKGVRKAKKDFWMNSLSPVINVKNRNELIVREYLKICPTEKTICFAIDIAHAVELAKEFQRRGIACQPVHGKLSDNERRKRLNDFKEGRIQVLTNCQILTEGFDEPSVSCLVMARPTCSKGLYTQMIGRGARLSPGKFSCKVLEFTDNEFDVCLLEDLVELPKRKRHMEEGEKISSYADRMRKELEDETQETVIHQIEITRKRNSEKLATDWQKNTLIKHGMTFNEPITELSANYLIGKIYGKS